MSFKLIADLIQLAVGIAGLVYGYTLIGLTLSQAVLVTGNIVFGMVAIGFYFLTTND
jgi:hypothetical protein